LLINSIQRFLFHLSLHFFYVFEFHDSENRFFLVDEKSHNMISFFTVKTEFCNSATIFFSLQQRFFWFSKDQCDLLRSWKIDNIEVDSHSDVNDCHDDCSVNFLNNDFKFLFFILNSLINVNDLSLKFFIVDLQNRKVNQYVFDLIL